MHRQKSLEGRINVTEGYIEKSVDATSTDLEKINQFTRTKFDADGLYIFNLVLCNNDIDRDYEKFSLDALNELKEKFVGKTGIFDHSMKSSDQKARIFDTYVEKCEGKKTSDNEDFYQLRAKAYMVKSEENLPLITEIEAGIKKEVSISCSVAKNICSICGTDKRTSYCEHHNGHKYDDKIAYSVLSDVKDAYEFSFVAVPAQREAGVTKSFVNFGKEFNMTDIISTLKSCSSDITLSKAQADGLISKLEALDEEAQLGREYKKSLTKEVISLCASAMPQLDLKVFSSVAQVMTTKELLEFKKAFSQDKEKTPAPQIKPENKTYNVNQFKI